MNTKYDWSNVPKEVKWIATDADGVINGFYKKPNPVCDYHMWFAKPNYQGDWVQIGSLENNCCDWKDSLEQRPLTP